jgi:threonine dehydratase
MKIVVEPTGCLGAAAALSGAHHKAGDRVGVIISGGNVDLTRFGGLLARTGKPDDQSDIPLDQK